jgi:hypothetical protein
MVYGALMPIWTKMTLRLPLQVHTALSDEAKRADTSLNQVIVDRLNASLGGVYITEGEANEARVVQRIADLEKQVGTLTKRVKALETPPDAAGLSIENQAKKIRKLAKGKSK